MAQNPQIDLTDYLGFFNYGSTAPSVVPVSIQTPVQQTPAPAAVQQSAPAAAMPSAQPAAVLKPKKAAPQKPAVLAETETLPTLKEVLDKLGFDGLQTNYPCSSSELYELDKGGYANLSYPADVNNPVSVTSYSYSAMGPVSKFSILYVDEKMNIWYSNFLLPKALRPGTNSNKPSNHVPTAGFTMSKWRLGSGKIFPDWPSFVQNEYEIRAIAENISPWGVKFCDSKNIPLEKYVCAPQIEQIMKSGYVFPERMFVGNWSFTQGFCEKFNRLTQLGSCPKEIFKMRESIAKELKSNNSIETFDVIRKLDKVSPIEPDVAKTISNGNYKPDEIEKICELLKAKSPTGNPVFNWNSLSDYLEKLDCYEALEKKVAIPILYDYIALCRKCHVQPRIDGDSLRREHDVMARTCRKLEWDRAMSIGDTRDFAAACSAMAKYNYEEDVFFIRGIRDYKDLISEAQGQHNCLAAYRDYIEQGKKMIFVMRAKGAPDESLITVELAMNGKRIVQKSRKYNQPIRNKAQTDFLNRWLAHCRALK